MREHDQPAELADPPLERASDPGTLPQWKPPAAATLAKPPAAATLAKPPAAATLAKPPAAATRAQSGSRPREGEPLALASTMAAGMDTSSQEQDLPSVLSPGLLIGGRYVIEEALSSGGFGAVYRASDRQIRNHQVALKLLHAPAASQQATDQALRELTLIASVSHPSVVQFKDYGWHEGRLWFAMPLYRGATLAERFNASAPITRAEAHPIFERLARGLAAMHEVGIHHHDIKPENVFLADIAGFQGGLPVLLDLGIAAPRGEGPGGLTVEYTAPETAAAALGNPSQPIGEAADVFSLALLLRNLLEPESAPRQDAELIPLLHRRATQPVTPPQGRDLRYLKPYFERWLSLEPDERPSAEELAEELAILTAPEERRQSRRRMIVRLLPVLAAALLAVGGLWLELTRQKVVLSEQQKRLSEEIQESDELRSQSEQQLLQMEKQMAAIGSKDRELSRAVSIARQLHDRLEKTEAEQRGLARRLRKTEGERRDLAQERDALQDERTSLLGEREALTRTRDRLQRERDTLSAEREALTLERDDLRLRQGELSARLQKTEQQLSTAEAERATLEKRERALAASQELLRTRTTQLDTRIAELDRENTKLLAENTKLERKLAEVQQQLLRARAAPTEEAPPP